ncbi:MULTISPECIES: PP2C family serine/threonine-protein phosphatase [unclassified Massilia]|uniref:PP2C family protein-serine/threonine phosphatase n=1 Tax=unclassified Massilia TaxID=2609279 RepID=UPI00177FBE2F|nr:MULTISPECIES: protein phosphatase 2C domain-containing protein [unclassified Massilia]MBD8528375.1 serine/threonine-protein phosphatase [Massilia sp. CFBP 13647]MBD8672003.1 serine/threonine-protein phosphatase [Massilia sp. CFBP 13721]
MTSPTIPLSPMRVYRLPAMAVFGATDIGTVRRSNEDNFMIDEALGVAMLADGMGGHDAGEVASAGVLTALRDYLALHAPGLPVANLQACLDADPDATWSDPAAGAVRLLHAAVNHANASLYTQNCARNREDGGGMGTTLTGFWHSAHDAPLVVFHVGDSRFYRLRAGVLEQLTRDQTLYQQAIEAGMLDQLPARNLLLQAVGPSAAITAEVRSHPVTPGDVLMLCSDGLHGSVPHADIEAALALAAGTNLDQVCARLIEMAKVYGSRDNITVVVALCGPG